MVLLRLSLLQIICISFLDFEKMCIFSAYNYDSRSYDDEYDDYAPKSNYQPYGGGSGKKLNSYMKFLNTR